MNPVFTCFSSADEGLPLNPRNAFYYQTTPDSLGFTANPSASATEIWDWGPSSEAVSFRPQPERGLDTVGPECRRPVQVMARNAAADTATVSHHRGAGPTFRVLPQWLHQEPEAARALLPYTRDLYPFDVPPALPGEERPKEVDCWPGRRSARPRLRPRQSRLDGSGGEPDRRVPAGLTDGFTTPYPDINTFLGTCMTGGSAATQGNDSSSSLRHFRPARARVCGVAPLPSANVDGPLIPCPPPS